MSLRSIKKSNVDEVFCGVCGGLGLATPIPSWMWRIGFCLAVWFTGFGLFAYILLAIFMPDSEDTY